MSRGSTFRRTVSRSRGIDGGSIKKQEPVSKKNLLWMIEKARRECARREERLNRAVAVTTYYWGLFMKLYPDEAKAILEHEKIMIEEQKKAKEEVKLESQQEVVQLLSGAACPAGHFLGGK